MVSVNTEVLPRLRGSANNKFDETSHDEKRVYRLAATHVWSFAMICFGTTHPRLFLLRLLRHKSLRLSAEIAFRPRRRGLCQSWPLDQSPAGSVVLVTNALGAQS